MLIGVRLVWEISGALSSIPNAKSSKQIDANKKPKLSLRSPTCA